MARSLRRSMQWSLRSGARRATGAAAARYRTAVLDQSRWLPVYLTAVDAADVALRAARVTRGRPVLAGSWDEPDPGEAAVLRAGLSATGELSLVLTGPAAWRRTVCGVALVADGVRRTLDGGLLEHAAERVQLCVPLAPLERLAAGRWQVVLLDAAGGDVPRTPVARRAVRTQDGRSSIRLEVDDGALVLVRGHDDPATIEHRVTTGIARLTVEWTPPDGTASELLLLGPDGGIVQRVAGAPTSPGFAFAATLDAATLDSLPADETVLTVAVPGPDAPAPLVLAPGEYPALFAAPRHGTARLGRSRMSARYDSGNRLQLRTQNEVRA